ncbi:hypothetical protein CS542_09060 [Pedobacter sp. IW39]|nr:hypothetical protein CS542_09060 [Pedobacter sp. IW39]
MSCWLQLCSSLQQCYKRELVEIWQICWHTKNRYYDNFFELGRVAGDWFGFCTKRKLASKFMSKIFSLSNHELA